MLLERIDYPVLGAWLRNLEGVTPAEWRDALKLLGVIPSVSVALDVLGDSPHLDAPA